MSVADLVPVAEALEHAARRGDADAVEHLMDDLGRRIGALGPGASVAELRAMLALLDRSAGLLGAQRDALRRELGTGGWDGPAELLDGRG